MQEKESNNIKRIWPLGLSRFIAVLLVTGLSVFSVWIFFFMNNISFIPWIQNVTKDIEAADLIDNIWGEDELEKKENKKESADKGSKKSKKKSKSKAYILKDSNKKYISLKRLKKLTKKELAAARNEIYARKGRKFTSKKWKNYFKKKKWYQPKYKPQYFDKHEKKILNKYERENIRRIKKIEKKKK